MLFCSGQCKHDHTEKFYTCTGAPLPDPYKWVPNFGLTVLQSWRGVVGRRGLSGVWGVWAGRKRRKLFFEIYFSVTIVTTFCCIFSTGSCKWGATEMEVKEPCCWEPWICATGVLEWQSGGGCLQCTKFSHWCIPLQIYKKYERTQQGESVKRKQNLNYSLIFFPVLTQPSPIHTISIWVILQNLIYTAVHNSHKRAADCVCYQTSQQSNFQRDCLKVFRQRERVSISQLLRVHVFLHALPRALWVYFQKSLIYFS